MITLISDIDGTLLGDVTALKNFNEYIMKIKSNITLVYATGRNYNECLSAINSDGLLKPDALISSTGADIHLDCGNGLIQNFNWHKYIHKDGWNIQLIRELISTIPGLQPQPYFSPYKTSYYVNSTDQKRAEKEIVQLMKTNLISCKVIASHGVYIDVLPENCDKGAAALFLINEMKIESKNVIVAGDSENDIDLFLKFKHGVIVGNAHEPMKIALADGDYYISKMSHAAGIIDGLEYYIDKGVISL